MYSSAQGEAMLARGRRYILTDLCHPEHREGSSFYQRHRRRKDFLPLFCFERARLRAAPVQEPERIEKVCSTMEERRFIAA
jgi:hypothetical protein